MKLTVSILITDRWWFLANGWRLFVHLPLQMDAVLIHLCSSYDTYKVQTRSPINVINVDMKLDKFEQKQNKTKQS